ncbi:MAG: alpha/beta hydrolase [Solirubrobacteraceae bacterium]
MKAYGSRLAVSIAAIVLAGAICAVAFAARVDRDVAYKRTSAGSLRLDVYRPAGFHGPRPAVLLFHGGGWNSGDKAELADEGRRLARLGYVALSVNYRLEPPAPFPATILDALSAVRWVRRHAHGLNVDPTRLGALGSSAGGNLAALLATMGQGSWRHGNRLRVAVSYSGVMDLSYRSRSSATPAYYLGCSPQQCPSRYAYASPMHHVDRSDPPLLVVNSRNEQMTLTEATRMTARMRRRHQRHELIVLPGSRHALEYEADVRSRTFAFLRRALRPEK